MIGFRVMVWTFFSFACGLFLGCNQTPIPDGAASLRPPRPSVRAKQPEPTVEVQTLVKVTPKAAETLNRIIADRNIPGASYLRVRVVPGGCCGFLHKLDLDPQTSSEDQIFESGGVKVVVFKRQIEMLRGSQVDYGQAGDQEGFKIQNPNFEGESVKKWLRILEHEKDTK